MAPLVFHITHRLIPVMGIIISLFLMFTLPWDTWARLIVWLLIGLVIYFGHSRKHSRLRLAAAEPEKRIEAELAKSTESTSP
jgi:C-terminus of AA_permease